MLGDGTLLGITPGFSHAIIEGTLTSIAQVRMDRGGALLDTILTVPTGRENVLGVHSGSAGTYTSQPFGDGILTVVDPRGESILALDRRAATSAGPAEFHVHRINLSGDTVLSRSIGYSPISIGRDTVDAFVTGAAGGLQRMSQEFFADAGMGESDWKEAVRTALHLPAYFTPVSRMLAGRDGSIWLALNPRHEPGVVEWLILDASGDPVTKIKLSDRLQPMLVERSRFWGIARDDLDVDYIVRVHIEDS